MKKYRMVELLLQYTIDMFHLFMIKSQMQREFDVFKDCSKYPYNSSDPYGSDDLQTTFAEGLDKVTFITTQRY